MIAKVVHIRTADSADFTAKLRCEVAKMQNECNLDVEIQYQTASMTDERQYVVYSALVIGRVFLKTKGGE